MRSAAARPPPVEDELRARHVRGAPHERGGVVLAQVQRGGEREAEVRDEGDDDRRDDSPDDDAGQDKSASFRFFLLRSSSSLLSVRASPLRR
jgi:hypothetical protein